MAIYTLNNLITDSSFENDLWNGGNYSTTEYYNSTRSLYFSTGTTVVATSQVLTVQPIVGHKYYGRRYIKTNGDNQPPDCRFELFAGDGPGLNWVFAWNRGNYPNWGFDSSIQTIDVLNGSNYYMRCFNVGTTADTWIDGVMLIDLTDCFGAGKEPTKEWCDKYIPYFDGTYVLEQEGTAVGELSIGKLYLGDIETNRLYLGTQLIYEGIPENALPCYCKSIIHDSSCSNVIDTTATEVFYIPDGRIVISFLTNTISTSYVDDGHTLLPGVSAEYSNKTYTSGYNGLIVLTGVTKPFNISVTTSGNYIKIAMTEATGVSKYISKLYIQSLTFTGSYASSTYFTESACGIGYSENGKVAILMKNGTTTSYENISFSAYNMLPGVTLSSQTAAASTNNSTNRYYMGILEGLNVDCDIQILMGQRSSGSDYVGANIIMSEV